MDEFKFDNFTANPFSIKKENCISKPKAFIFGAGVFGKYYLPIIKEHYEILGYLDNKTSLWNSKVNGVEVFSPDVVKQKEFDTIITAVNNGYVPVIKRQLLSFGVENSKIIQLNFNRIPRPFGLHSLDIHLTEHCNLNCAYCNHFSNIAEKEFVNVKLFEKDLKRLSKLTNEDLGTILLLGGEPLLHPKLIQLMNITRKYFNKITKIILVTNGILLTKQSKEFWESVKRNRISISISHYPIKLDIDKIKELSVRHSVIVGHNFSEVLGSTSKRMVKPKYDLNGNGDLQINFDMCVVANRCITLKKGLLYTCPFPAHSEHFFNKFGFLKKCEKDSINIYKAKNANELIDFVTKPIPFCRFCREEERGLEWRPSKKEISEWT